MFEAFIWLFYKDDFKNHFFRLFSLIFIFWIPLFIVASIIYLNRSLFDEQILFYIGIIFTIGLILPFFAITGYFWELTESIINRETDIVANNIYNNKILTKNIIDLPAWNLRKFIWRGFASIVATIIMYIPYILLFTALKIRIPMIAAYWGWSSEQTMIITSVLVIFSCLLIPGLLWNYARRDSVVAVLNIPKAFDLMCNHTIRYILHSVLLVIVYFISSFLTSYLSVILGISGNLDMLADGYFIAAVKLIILLLSCHLINIYFIFIYAHILGTLFPTYEN